MFFGIVSIGTRSAYPRWSENFMQRRATSASVLLPAVLWASLGFAAPQENRTKQQPAAKQSSITGCVDEQEGRYVLIHDQTRALVANLQAEGFPSEGFAKHLGHKVTVRGAVTSEGSQPTIKVRSIETVSDTCGPQRD
jgi:hypothetical protein